MISTAATPSRCRRATPPAARRARPTSTSAPTARRSTSATEDYSDVDRWASANLASEQSRRSSHLLTTYLDGNLGLDNNLVDFWSQASAVAQKKPSIAGVGRRRLLRRTGRRRRSRTARRSTRTTRAAFRTGTQDVAVNAKSQNDTIDLGGNFQTTGIGTDHGQHGRLQDLVAEGHRQAASRRFTFEGVGRRGHEGRGRRHRAGLLLHQRRRGADRGRRLALRRQRST